MPSPKSRNEFAHFRINAGRILRTGRSRMFRVCSVIPGLSPAAVTRGALSGVDAINTTRRIRRSSRVVSRRFASFRVVKSSISAVHTVLSAWFDSRELHQGKLVKAKSLGQFFRSPASPIMVCCAPQSSKPTSVFVGDGVNRLEVCAEAVSTAWRYQRDPGGRTGCRWRRRRRPVRSWFRRASRSTHPRAIGGDARRHQY
jgi:hypothetical protein